MQKTNQKNTAWLESLLRRKAHGGFGGEITETWLGRPSKALSPYPSQPTTRRD
ncbi:MAG TPA: hypothetical protein VHZ51_19245 [Ktedonobacteraceae bacterium]|nr:hypothetical protein [Ktedonobacteraceae bacterium]